MDLDEAILQHNEVGEPDLTYWNPNPPPVANLPQNFDRFPSSEQLNGTIYPPNSSFEYPLPDIVHSFVQDQQVRLSTGSYRKCEGSRRMARQPQLNPQGLLSAISGQPSQPVMNDGLIHDEVTRAAKTLFSKRNRTLLHWLNPGVSKSQLKIDVNAAWDSLPAAEKVFYISQVLGKFAPHTTSLMVNPQLSGESLTLVESTVSGIEHAEDNANIKSNAGCPPSDNHRCTCKKHPRGSRKYESRRKKIKVEPTSDDDASGTSELVKDVGPGYEIQEEIKPKRKYKKRQSKQNFIEAAEENLSIHTTLGESNKITIKTECASPTASTSSQDLQATKNYPRDQKKVTTDSILTPKTRRKYIKRKLERKKYTRRIPKEVSKPSEEALTKENTILGQTSNQVPNALEDMDELCQTSNQVSNPLDDMDVLCQTSNQVPPNPLDGMNVYIELNDDAFFEGVEPLQLLDEDVDSFWDTIKDPESFFEELDII